MRKQYKEKISDYRIWDQLDHADEYILYSENFGEDMSLDETCLSNGDVYTILTNKAARGGKGALAAMVRGVASDTVSAILRKVPLKQRLKVKTVTTDLTQAQIKMERSAEDTRPDIVHKVPRSGNGIWAVSKACGYIQRENFCRSRQTETRQMVQ